MHPSALAALPLCDSSVPRLPGCRPQCPGSGPRPGDAAIVVSVRMRPAFISYTLGASVAWVCLTVDSKTGDDPMLAVELLGAAVLAIWISVGFRKVLIGRRLARVLDSRSVCDPRVGVPCRTKPQWRLAGFSCSAQSDLRSTSVTSSSRRSMLTNYMRFCSMRSTIDGRSRRSARPHSKPG